MKRDLTAKKISLSVVQISKGNLMHNFNQLRKSLPDKVKILSIVKANAYGHDMEIIQGCLDGLTDFFGVADVYEAIALRDAGCNKPILVLGPVMPDDLVYYQKYSLIAVIGTFEELEYITSDISFHLEFDTGMGKLGFYPHDWNAVQRVLHELKLVPTGVMTHFATADEPESDMVARQFDEFRKLQDQISLEYPNLIWHASNSAAIVHFPETVCSMVRPGISLYGYGAAKTKLDLRIVLSWKSFVSVVRPIAKGSSVSYGATWAAPYDGWLLVIPVGYADGIPRNLSNRIEINVDGKMYPQVGAVTMDYIMAFSKDPIERRAEVEILGPNSLNAQHWADLLHTIPYEILCGIHPKIERVLVD
jgi:alanine racemase